MKNTKLIFSLFSVFLLIIAISFSTAIPSEADPHDEICEKVYYDWEETGEEPCRIPALNCYCEVVVPGEN